MFIFIAQLIAATRGEFNKPDDSLTITRWRCDGDIVTLDKKTMFLSQQEPIHGQEDIVLLPKGISVNFSCYYFN